MEIEELKKQSKVFRNSFQMLIEAHLDLISNDDWDHLLEYNVEPVFEESEEKLRVYT